MGTTPTTSQTTTIPTTTAAPTTAAPTTAAQTTPPQFVVTLEIPISFPNTPKDQVNITKVLIAAANASNCGQCLTPTYPPPNPTSCPPCSLTYNVSETTTRRLLAVSTSVTTKVVFTADNKTAQATINNLKSELPKQLSVQGLPASVVAAVSVQQTIIIVQTSSAVTTESPSSLSPIIIASIVVASVALVVVIAVTVYCVLKNQPVDDVKPIRPSNSRIKPKTEESVNPRTPPKGTPKSKFFGKKVIPNLGIQIPTRSRGSKVCIDGICYI